MCAQRSAICKCNTEETVTAGKDSQVPHRLGTNAILPSCFFLASVQSFKIPHVSKKLSHV